MIGKMDQNGFSAVGSLFSGSLLGLSANSQSQQERLGGLLAGVCPADCVLYLQGEIGTGKTTFVRGFLRGLGYQGAVKSPTYTLMEPYEVEGRSIWHMDLYRLGDPEELEYLGLRDLLQDEAMLLIEWPERGRGLLPTADLKIVIGYQGQGRRLELMPESGKGKKIIHYLVRQLQQEVNE